MVSEVAQFRQQQALQEQAALLGLSGFVIIARHDFIEARAQQGAERILRLLAEGKEAEALALMNEPQWGLEAATSKPSTAEEEHGLTNREG